MIGPTTLSNNSPLYSTPGPGNIFPKTPHIKKRRRRNCRMFAKFVKLGQPRTSVKLLMTSRQMSATVPIVWLPRLIREKILPSPDRLDTDDARPITWERVFIIILGCLSQIKTELAENGKCGIRRHRVSYTANATEPCLDNMNE